MCAPSVRPASACGLVHGAQAPPSSRHWKVEPVSEELNWNVGAASLSGFGGWESIVVCGAVVSTVQV